MIDLLTDTQPWTEHEILASTEAMVRQHFSLAAEGIINRKLQGAAMGQYTLAPEEQAEIAQFQSVVFAAQQAGIQARADNARLAAVLDYEAAQRRLARPLYDGPTEIETEEGMQPHPDLLRDQAERAAAQEVVDGADEGTLHLAAEREALRNLPNYFRNCAASI